MLMQDRKSTKTAEQTVKEAEQIVAESETLEELEDCLAKAAQGLQFFSAKINFYHDDNCLGAPLHVKSPSTAKSIYWQDPEHNGYFARDNEFSVEFAISGRNFAYGKVQYVFMDGRSALSVQDEVLLERIHDAISNLATRLRKKEYSI